MLAPLVMAASTAAFTTDLAIRECTLGAGCSLLKTRIALDATSNHTSSSGAELISVGGADGDQLTLTYGGSDVGGPRVYLIEPDGTNKNHMFMLKGREFTFDVELSSMPCGFNAALYFVGMDANEGGAEQGTKYCDAQAVGGTFCSEMDLFEANTEAQQYTTHACVDACGSYGDAQQCKGTGSPSTVCDQSGCGLNPFRYGPGTTYNAEYNNPKWYGPGTGHTLDSTKKYTVVTRFNVDASGDLKNITRFYQQNGARIDLPTLYVLPPTDGSHMGGFANPAITSDFCADIYDRWNGNAGLKPLAQMGKNMANGMTLAMSAWYAKETYPLSGSQTGMSWLDGTNNWGKIIKAGPCSATTTDAGSHHATFSNIRVGEIGSTVPNAPPAPTPPSPATPSPPAPGQCCYGGCASGNCAAPGFCTQSKANCEGNCNGAWCTKQ
eukprot:Hpha_TRINITY_DN15099_c0_g1::TRINITY_DN15099_c0_g1_i2::g.125982::m.125982/K01225/CBH1; cellulose 1,4-beta-cellobiosidase